jgi:uncharacterized protein (DUF433 family)
MKNSSGAVNELDAQIATLSAADKIALHNKIVQSLAENINANWPGIEKTPDVVGGEARVVRSRIPVWVLENFRRLGWGDEKILKNYPTLQLWDLQNAWLYVSANQDEIDRTIHENEAA